MLLRGSDPERRQKYWNSFTMNTKNWTTSLRASYEICTLSR